LAVVGLRAQEAAAPAPAKDEKGDKLVTLDKFEVTGSRIKRLDAETVSPVVRVTNSDINLQGFVTLGDALRAMPFSSGQALTPTDSGNSFSPGISTINLRGLGNNSTLVLINGRRAVPYAAPGFNGFQTMFDLNSIPDAAIESFEILKDGGSALYGSDAVAGVVNIKLRRDFEGAMATVQVGDYFNTGGFFKRGSAIMGTTSAKTSVMAAVSWEERDAVFARDLVYSRDSNKSLLNGYSYWTVDNYQSAGYKTAQEYMTANELTNPVKDGVIGDNSSSRGYPGYVVVGGKRRTFASPTTTPTTAGSMVGRNFYNFQQESGLFPEYRRYSFYTAMRHEMTDSLYAFSELSFNRVHTMSAAASTPADLEGSNGLTAGSLGVTTGPEQAWGLHIPSYNAYNPWGVDIFSGRRRLSEAGPRVNDVTADSPRLLAGLGGTLSGGWTWEAAAMYSSNTVTNLNLGTVTDYGLQQALMGLTRQGDGSLKWNPATPRSERVYYNWFGPSDPAMASFLSISNPTSQKLEYTSFDVSTSGTVFESLPSGGIGLAIGAEHRLEKFQKNETDLNATGNILGGAEGTSSAGTRNLSAVYAEADIPILKNLPFVQSLEAQIAGRYEEYSDKGFAKQARPKLGIKYRPLSWLVLRASFAKSFKAPDMAYLYTASQTSFTPAQIRDPITGNEIDQLQIVTGGNRELKPELTDTYYAGVTVSPTGKLEGLNVSVDWFKFKQKNLLAQLSDFYGYSQFLSEAAAGNPLFAGKVVREAGSNEVLYIRDDYANISTGLYRGMDFDVNYTWKNTTLGTFRFGAQFTWVDRIEVDGSNIIGSYLSPRWNGDTNVSWNKGDWGVNLHGIFHGRRTYTGTYGSLEADETLYYNYDIKSQYTQNVSVTYRGFRNLELTVGVNNVFSSAPPVDYLDNTGTTAGINEVEPSFWYVRAEHKF
jgi:outer membrane receptor protein involved in Fe transport